MMFGTIRGQLVRFGVYLVLRVPMRDQSLLVPFIVSRAPRFLCIALACFMSLGAAAQQAPYRAASMPVQVSDQKIESKVEEKKSILTIEEERLTDALNAIPELEAQISDLKVVWSAELAASHSVTDLCNTVERLGLVLWRNHSGAVQARDPFDDRALYWQRLAMAPLARVRADVLGLTASARAALIARARYPRENRGVQPHAIDEETDTRCLRDGRTTSRTRPCSPRCSARSSRTGGSRRSPRTSCP